MKTGPQFLQMTLQIGRRRDKNQSVVLLGNTVQVVVEVDLVDIEVYAGKIGGVMAQTSEFLDTVITTHVPTDVVGMPHHNLSDRCCPAAAADDCYLATVVHILLFIATDEHGFLRVSVSFRVIPMLF